MTSKDSLIVTATGTTTESCRHIHTFLLCFRYNETCPSVLVNVTKQSGGLGQETLCQEATAAKSRKNEGSC